MEVCEKRSQVINFHKDKIYEYNGIINICIDTISAKENNNVRKRERKRRSTEEQQKASPRINKIVG